ncbi:nucleoside diphosphate kinase 2, chloroplastic-like isoform X2 [Panicum virgatum]|uniref:nucleoside diphosphate kinase 2, chloroplastic-like isoform X2 n=1 Tax=Panicum virgatum TaxID=38727 RepID=UPI0019D580B9|nr:nucleoside diphosphate kinase 2, chloroplastic-like isoform X2 [Panicum virgatum]
METMAVLARTAPPLAGTGRRPSAAVRPSAFLSFAAASTGTRGRVARGLSTTTVGSGSAARARAVPRGIVASSEVEQSYIMIKPDGVQRGLVGEIISRFEKKGFLLKGLKLFQCSKDLAQAWEGDGVVASARKLIGATNPLQAEPGTIRGDLAVQTGRNVVHGSDSPVNGKREIDLWFKEGELCQWESVQTPWLVE